MIRKKNTKRFILLGVLVVAMLTLMNYTKFDRAGVSPMESSLKDALSPVQGLAMSLGHRLRGLVSFPFTLVGAADENQLMKKKITELEGRLRQYDEVRAENDRLKKMLDFKAGVAQTLGYDLVGASVIGRDPGNWFGIITINKGARDGLKTNMAVLSEQGLVGRITSVSQNTAEVLLVTDSRSGVASLVQESRTPGIIEGIASSPGRVRMVHIPIGIEINKGQTVVTSGLGSLYPKGIPIGWILEADKEPSGLFSSAVIVPFVDFNRLEEVMVITGARSPQAAAKIAQLPYPWGEGKNDIRGRSPGVINR
ncbi:MAG: rod shape-determining protein MreC [Desulfocucumaceae bacterium]